jgi:DNA-binding NarL/FixJ family response regulator
MAITVLGGDPALHTQAELALIRARRAMPRLGHTGMDLVIVTADATGYDPGALPPTAGLVVMTARPSVVQAAAAVILGARAYLPYDLDPDQSAAALARVTRGRPHIEPETAAALQELVYLAGGIVPSGQAAEVRLLLGLRARGWRWGEAATSAGLEPLEAVWWLERLLGRIGHW